MHTHNLRQIATAFNAAKADGGNVATAFPKSTDWPAIPMNAVSDLSIFTCPEDSVGGQANVDEYQVWMRTENVYLSFSTASAAAKLCRIVDTPTYTDYWFDDGWVLDMDDYLFRVSKSVPRIATFLTDPARTHGPGRITSLCRSGQVVPGWADLQAVPNGTTIILSGSGTSYGINAKVGVPKVGPDTIVLLDYNRAVANQSEDVGAEVRKSARHGGRLNVLYADESVRSRGPTSLDPLLDAEPWTP